MIKKLAMGLIGFAIITANAQTINLQGVVSNSAGKPISNAVVSLVRQKMKDTTGTDGKYSFVSTSVRKLSSIAPQMNDIKLNNGVLQFELSTQSPVKVEIFDLKGKLLRQEINMNAAAGTYRYDISNNCDASKVLVIKAAISMSEVTFRYMPLHNGKYVLSPVSEVSSKFSRTGLAPIADVVDTITVTATGYKTKSVAITSLSMQQNISLDSSSGGSTGSAGCGKTLSTLKSGTQSITSAGLSRRYIINIPTNYDPNKPYRLIFGMHCMCSSMEGVSNEQYYGLKTLADKAGIQCIYVAPSAYATDYTKVAANCTVWSQQEKDHTFFDDMLKLFKAELCVDTTRVFSAGFSFGAMFTYSLSRNHQKVLRAVATYAPANYNIYLPTATDDPIAYYQTTGTTDGTCPWDNGGRGGKYCLTDNIKRNGCTVPSNIPLATSNKHVSTEFSGCKEGYPVKFGSFQGGHSGTATDGGSSVNWIAQETWEFFMRF